MPTRGDCVGSCCVVLSASDNTGEFRVLRGGSFDDIPQWLRSAYRDGNSPGDRDFSIGFRVSSTTLCCFSVDTPVLAALRSHQPCRVQSTVARPVSKIGGLRPKYPRDPVGLVGRQVRTSHRIFYCQRVVHRYCTSILCIDIVHRHCTSVFSNRCLAVTDSGWFQNKAIQVTPQ